jgi:hypothetical protein
MISGPYWAPILKHPREAPGGNVWLRQDLRHMGEPETVQRCIENLEDSVEHELAIHPDGQLVSVAFELPGIKAAQGRKAQVDAGVADDVLGHCGQRAVGKAGGRPDHREADIGADAHRDHILGHLLTKAYARVETLLDDVRQSLIEGNLNLDVGVVGEELRQPRPENRLGGMVAGRDPDRARRLLAELAQPFELGFDFVQARTCRPKQALSRLRGRHAPGGAGQEPDPEPFLRAD